MKGEKTGLDGSRTLLEELGFEHAPHLVAELMEKAVREDLSYSAFLEDILRKEREFREERRIKTSFKLSDYCTVKEPPVSKSRAACVLKKSRRISLERAGPSPP